MAKRWALCRIKLANADTDPEWRSQLQDPLYGQFRWNFAYHRMPRTGDDGAPHPPWTLEPLDDAQRAIIKNDPDIYVFPAVSLATRLNQLTTAQAEPLQDFMSASGVDLTPLAGTSTIRDVLVYLGKDIDPTEAFDPDQYPLS